MKKMKKSVMYQVKYNNKKLYGKDANGSQQYLKMIEYVPYIFRFSSGNNLYFYFFFVYKIQETLVAVQCKPADKQSVLLKMHIFTNNFCNPLLNFVILPPSLRSLQHCVYPLARIVVTKMLFY